jgi:hypothetical protein
VDYKEEDCHNIIHVICLLVTVQDMEKMPDDGWVKAEPDNSQVRLRTKESAVYDISNECALCVDHLFANTCSYIVILLTFTAVIACRRFP